MKDTEILQVVTPTAREAGTNEAQSPRRILQSIGAVLAGFVAVVVLSLGTDIVLHATKIFPPWFQPMSSALFLVAMTYRIVYTVAGTYLMTRLAPYNPMGHALVGGAIGLVPSIAGVVLTWNAGPEFGPKWYPLSLVITAIPCAWVGGKLRILQLQRRHEI
jgi:hypothetical protein